MLPSTICPCTSVRRTCRRIVSANNDKNQDVENAANTVVNPHLSIDGGKLASLAKTIAASPPAAIEWDTEGWHYTAEDYLYPEEERLERVAMYVLALDAINFCFWPSPDGSDKQNSLEYEHLAVALRKLAEQDEIVSSDNTDADTAHGNNVDSEQQDQHGQHTPEESKQPKGYFFSPSRLAVITPQEMEAALKPHLQGHVIPNMEERCRLWNELGAGLITSYNGSVAKLLQACDSSAPKLVWLLLKEFPGFRDETIWTPPPKENSLVQTDNNGKTKSTTTTQKQNAMFVSFYKRAQICVGDLNAALELHLQHMDHLTTFADYRVPQVLRHWGVLQYGPVLTAKVDCRIEVDRDEETSIRAATVVAVDELVRMIHRNDKNDPTGVDENDDGNIMTNDHGDDPASTDTSYGQNKTRQVMNAVVMDWHLWQVGERMCQKGEMKPHHRSRTIFY